MSSLKLLMHQPLLKSLLVAIIAAFGLPAFAAHEDDSAVAKAAAKPNVVVTMCMASGNVIVRTWDREEVLATVDGASDVALRRADGTTNTPATRLEVQISEHEEAPDGSCKASGDVTLNVPRKAVLFIKTREGDIDVDGAGEVHLYSVSGSISARQVTDGVELNSSSGDVTVEGSSGRMRLSTVAGCIVASDLSPRDSADNLIVKSISGDVTLGGIRQATVEVRTTSGNVSMSGSLPQAARYDLNTTNGDISLEMPKDASFRVTARVFQGGDIVTDFPLKPEPGPSPKPEPPPHPGKSLAEGRLTGVYNSGDSILNLMSFSGSIRLRRE